MSGGLEVEDHSKDDSFSREDELRLCATTSENERMYSGSDWSRSATERVSAFPSTPSFSSRSKGTDSAARGFPIEFGPSRKKLFPASAPDVMAESKMVKWPTPGRTRFLRIDVDVAEEDRTRILDDSNAAWPVAAHNLSWVSGRTAHIVGSGG